jgi:hypothetical protein
MRVLLRHRQTGRLFVSPDRWTENAEAAQDFSSATRAIAYALDRGMTDVEVLLAFEDPRYNIQFPLRRAGQ